MRRPLENMKQNSWWVETFHCIELLNCINWSSVFQIMAYWILRNKSSEFQFMSQSNVGSGESKLHERSFRIAQQNRLFKCCQVLGKGQLLCLRNHVLFVQLLWFHIMEKSDLPLGISRDLKKLYREEKSFHDNNNLTVMYLQNKKHYSLRSMKQDLSSMPLIY